ncbi:hypothetical protein A3C59_04290 [Candidatus Daviesbacteria bacterium RIFCSPHIGHO2_02_FULL_36_13]|uniref:Uncharacterized protein n=1 Tax=Candidatus Daviesbacteria bacterium RIFCSPHIGHO2_02_FULL_36_13 TaxID=1797768 RepID=A0A1F5JW38_9BACT|nr:MAG: hypothetical protein A3C59_04290 [Candidatus Daviesbacteria bacterium RIFCSPHIGHO2_02_FULL_36_13]
MSGREAFLGPKHTITGIPEGNQSVGEFKAPPTELEELALKWPGLTVEQKDEVIWGQLTDANRAQFINILPPVEPPAPEFFQEIFDRIKRERGL